MLYIQFTSERRFRHYVFLFAFIRLNQNIFVVSKTILHENVIKKSYALGTKLLIHRINAGLRYFLPGRIRCRILEKKNTKEHRIAHPNSRNCEVPELKSNSNIVEIRALSDLMNALRHCVPIEQRRQICNNSENFRDTAWRPLRCDRVDILVLKNKKHATLI